MSRLTQGEKLDRQVQSYVAALRGDDVDLGEQRRVALAYEFEGPEGEGAVLVAQESDRDRSGRELLLDMLLNSSSESELRRIREYAAKLLYEGDQEEVAVELVEP